MVSKSTDDIQVKDIDSWKRGQVSYFSKKRMPEDALKSAYNTLLDYDGIIRPRGGFFASRVPDLPEGVTPLGCDFPFKRADDTEGLLTVASDGTNAHIYILRPDFSGWQKSSEVLDPNLPVSIDQVSDSVVIGNGVDKFTYYDISDDTIKQLVKVEDPTATPTATTTGFSGTAAFDYYYRVAFSGVGGHTKMSPARKISSSDLRDNWGSSKSVSISISGFTIDPNAQGWNIYIAQVPTGTGTPSDEEYLGVAEDLPVSQTSFVDRGSMKLLKTPPVENTTEGVLANYFKNISGRLWAIDSKGVVYHGGDPGHELYFGSAYGSDSHTVDVNGVERPMAVILGRDNAGTTCINLLTRTQAGQGAIWDVYATTHSTTASGENLSVGGYQFKKREGNDGTDAPNSVIHENNNTYYLSMDGFKSTGVKPNISGIQSTDIISSAIRDRVLNLSHASLRNTYAAYYDESLYWTVAYGTNKNNEIWVYDILHGGVWSIWRIPADCIFRWTSEEDESPSLYIRQGNKLLRYFKNSRKHADEGGVFESYIESGMIPYKKDNLHWVHLLKLIWQFDQAVGTVELTVNVHSKNGDIVSAKTVSLDSQTASSDVWGGWDAIQVSEAAQSKGAWDTRGWDESLAYVAGALDSSDKKVSQKIRKNAAYISFKVRANSPETYYELSHLSSLFTYIGSGMEFLSQKGVIKI